AIECAPGGALGACAAARTAVAPVADGSGTTARATTSAAMERGDRADRRSAAVLADCAGFSPLSTCPDRDRVGGSGYGDERAFGGATGATSTCRAVEGVGPTATASTGDREVLD